MGPGERGGEISEEYKQNILTIIKCYNLISQGYVRKQVSTCLGIDYIDVNLNLG